MSWVWSGFFLRGRSTFLVFLNASFGNKKLGKCFSKSSFVAGALCPADTVSKVLLEGLHHLWISWLGIFSFFFLSAKATCSCGLCHCSVKSFETWLCCVSTLQAGFMVSWHSSLGPSHGRVALWMSLLTGVFTYLALGQIF